jgi:cation diffusion facilitator family transporter
MPAADLRPARAEVAAPAVIPDAPAHHAERRTRLVALITAATMVLEIAAGWWFNSMALLADGWHMGTHAAAIGLSAVAYALARRWRSDPRFTFGPWKVEVLAAFASAIALLAAAVGIAAASVERLVSPQPIRYEEAIAVAALGLVVNLVCAWLLGPHDHGPGGHAHSHDVPAPHGHGHGHGHGHHHHAHHPHQHDPAHEAAPSAAPRHAHADLNLRSAYLHVVADAATSALAIVALAAGLWLGWRVLDPIMGVVGALMIARWGLLLVRDTGAALLDREMRDPLVVALRHALDEQAPWADRAELTSLRLWRVERNRWMGALRLTSSDPGLSAARVRRYLRRWPELAEVTIEIEMR